MEPDFRRHFYGVLNAMPISQAQENGAAIAQFRVQRDAAIEDAGGGVENLKKARPVNGPDLARAVRLNRNFLTQ